MKSLGNIATARQNQMEKPTKLQYFSSIVQSLRNIATALQFQTENQKTLKIKLQYFPGIVKSLKYIATLLQKQT